MCLANFACMVVGVGVRNDAAMCTWGVRVSDLLPGNSETCEAADRWLVKLFWFGGDVAGNGGERRVGGVWARGGMEVWGWEGGVGGRKRRGGQQQPSNAS